jgi:hypothetical protein
MCRSVQISVSVNVYFEYLRVCSRGSLVIDLVQSVSATLGSQTTRGVRRGGFDVIQKSHHPDGRGWFGEKSPYRRVAASTSMELVDARAFSSAKYGR